MAFIKRTWKDRVSEYPNRRMLTKEDGSTELVMVSRAEGEVREEGDAFSEDNMNDLEERIADTFGGFSFYPEKLTQTQYDALPATIKTTKGLIFVIVKE